MKDILKIFFVFLFVFSVSTIAIQCVISVDQWIATGFWRTEQVTVGLAFLLGLILGVVSALATMKRENMIE